MTKSAMKLRESTMKWKEKKSQELYQLEKEEQDRKDRYNKVKGMVQGNPQIKDNTKALKDAQENKIKQAKAAIKETEKNYKNQLKDMYARIADKPIMVEEYDKKNFGDKQKSRALMM